MTSIALSPQSETLAQSLTTQHQLPERALRALRRVSELERELLLLRDVLTDLPEQTPPDSVWQDQVANLLSRVVLFRVALAESPILDDIVIPSEQEDLPTIGYRALRG